MLLTIPLYVLDSGKHNFQFLTIHVHSLSGRLVSAKGDLVDGLSWALWVLGLLGKKSNTALVACSWDNTNSLPFHQ